MWARDRQAGARIPARASHARDQTPDVSGAEVGVDVATVEQAEVGVVDDVGADDRAVAVAAVILDDDRRDPRSVVRVGVGTAEVVWRKALVGGPAEVRTLGAAARQVVDLLPGALSDVADREVAVRRVE